MKKKKVDATDIRILNLLLKNAGMSNKDLASRVNLTEGPCLVRQQKLWERGIIESYTAKINYRIFGYVKYYSFHISILKMHSRMLRERFMGSRHVICHYSMEIDDDLLSEQFSGIIQTSGLDQAAAEMQKLIMDVDGIRSVSLKAITFLSQKPLRLETSDIVK